ncbi:hypothetical protein SDC9_119643 [bioreactor metagenome]|uniref:Uncharacterized protein n=1 Tax=bioreactor metagenome TaxID=1076179 RepID=A0A645C671_9ZZZZ
MQDIEALHAFHSTDDISSGITLGMADMQTGSAGVGKHIQAVKLRFRIIPYIGFESFMRKPILLPFFFNLLVIIIHKCFLHIKSRPSRTT